MGKTVIEAHIVEIREAVDALNADLPRLARDTIATYLDQSDPHNQSFLEHPDGRDQHQVHWHQWGIITHTRVFLAALDREVPRLLAEWGVWDAVHNLLDQPIDGVARWELLHAAVLLHDIGKFAARTNSKTGFHFARHERMSGEVIRSFVHLERYGFTRDQSAYIAETAEDHFVLGLVRKRAREEGQYDERYTDTDRFVALCREIKRDHPGDFCEIGVLFLGDSLAKVDPGNGPPRALSQHHLNLQVARGYLRITLDCPSI